MINSNELLFTVDETNRPIEPAERKTVHTQGIWHRTSHIYVINSKGDVLVHLRSPLKDDKPNRWDTRFGGHVLAGSDYDSTAISELWEETGIKASLLDLIPIRIDKYDGGTNREFPKSYMYIFEGNVDEIKLEPDEIVEVKWMSPEDIQMAIEEDPAHWVMDVEEFNDIYESIKEKLDERN
jgi:8-oxo-dGTP diphosphatase